MSTACDAVMDLIPLYRDKSVSEGTRKFVEKHLKICPECRRYYRDYVKFTKIPLAFSGSSGAIGVIGSDFDALARRIRKRRNTVYLGTLFFLGGALFASVKIAQSIGKKNCDK